MWLRLCSNLIFGETMEIIFLFNNGDVCPVFSEVFMSTKSRSSDDFNAACVMWYDDECTPKRLCCVRQKSLGLLFMPLSPLIFWPHHSVWFPSHLSSPSSISHLFPFCLQRYLSSPALCCCSFGLSFLSTAPLPVCVILTSEDKDKWWSQTMIMDEPGMCWATPRWHLAAVVFKNGT